MADELTAAENMKNEFISSVSHELRTPLTAIRGWAETINDMPYDKETMQKGMHVILNETDRLSGMVEELLDFSRIQSGRFTLIQEKLDIVAELSDAVLIFTERAKQEDKKLFYEEPPEIAVIVGDRNRLRQVFINVIDNALKYSDAGDTVTVDATQDGELFTIRIADTGCGISKQDLPRVKEKFFKANNTRRGSGIGLAVANEIVSMLGGYMDIESELDVGTCVTIRLPLDQVDVLEDVESIPDAGSIG
jgi:signal transduction histidine kinase